jgi:hypothetical protein
MNGEFMNEQINLGYNGISWGFTKNTPFINHGNME